MNITINIIIVIADNVWDSAVNGAKVLFSQVRKDHTGELWIREVILEKTPCWELQQPKRKMDAGSRIHFSFDISAACRMRVRIPTWLHSDSTMFRHDDIPSWKCPTWLRWDIRYLRLTSVPNIPIRPYFGCDQYMLLIKNAIRLLSLCTLTQWWNLGNKLALNFC